MSQKKNRVQFNTLISNVTFRVDDAQTIQSAFEAKNANVVCKFQFLNSLMCGLDKTANHVVGHIKQKPNIKTNNT